MKQTIIYEADDGKTFNNKEDCKKYELILHDLDVCMSKLNPSPRQDTDFLNGYGYVQQDLKCVELVKDTLSTLFKETFGLELNPRCEELLKYPAFYKALFKIECIDTDGREWGQPFYAKHPSQGDNFRIDMNENKTL